MMKKKYSTKAIAVYMILTHAADPCTWGSEWGAYERKATVADLQAREILLALRKEISKGDPSLMRKEGN